MTKRTRLLSMLLALAMLFSLLPTATADGVEEQVAVQTVESAQEEAPVQEMQDAPAETKQKEEPAEAKPVEEKQEEEPAAVTPAEEEPEEEPEEEAPAVEEQLEEPGEETPGAEAQQEDPAAEEPAGDEPAGEEPEEAPAAAPVEEAEAFAEGYALAKKDTKVYSSATLGKKLGTLDEDTVIYATQLSEDKAAVAILFAVDGEVKDGWVRTEDVTLLTEAETAAYEQEAADAEQDGIQLKNAAFTAAEAPAEEEALAAPVEGEETPAEPTEPVEEEIVPVIPADDDEGEETEPAADIEIVDDGEAEPAEGEETEPVEGEGTEPVEGEEGEPAEGEAAESVEGEEGETTEGEAEEPAEETEAEIVALVMVTFVSTQEIELTVQGSNDPVNPATEEEIAAYLATKAEMTEVDEAETTEPAETVEDAAVIFRAIYLLSPENYSYTAAATGYQTVEGTFAIAEDSSDTTITLLLEKALPYGFKGMPEGYKLSANQIATKRALKEHDVVSTLKGMKAGTDYIEGEVFFLADSRDYAETVAEAYSASLKSFSNGVAVIALETATVVEAVSAAADMDLPLPCVEANTIFREVPVRGTRQRVSGKYQQMSGEDTPVFQNWKNWYDSVANPDPFLKDPTSEDYQYMHDAVNSYAAWAVTQGNGVTVAVLDTGVVSHEDLSGLSYLYASINDAGGEHGTHVAGIIAATQGNGKGGSGIAPKANVISVPVLNTKGSGSTAEFIAGLNVAISSGAKIFNMSLGNPAYSPEVEEILRKAVGKGITLVAAMGNDGTNIKFYPAAYDIPGLIAVRSSTEAGTLSSFSNYGAWADVTAPGSAINSTVPGGYDIFDGTSMATPVVSGICALYLSVHKNTSPAEMERIIKSATTNGIIDASKLFSIGKAKVSPTIKVSGLSSGKAPYGVALTIAADGFDYFVYTLDGKTPSVKDGKVVTGEVYTGPILIRTENGFTVGKKTTVKAIGVNELGEVSKIGSLSFTVGYASATSVAITPAPTGVIAGKSVPLTAIVSPAEAEQKVTWSLNGGVNCQGVKIDEKTGVLKTPASKSGSVWVKATTSNGKAATIDITFSPRTPVKTITMEAAVTLGYSQSHAQYKQLSPTASSADGTKITDVKFVWTSSNASIAKVDQSGKVTATGKGKAVITAMALDGSGVTAKCNVTVEQKVESILISGPEYVAPGKTATYKVTVSPSTANNKKVSWSCSGGGSIINGKLTVPSSASIGSTITVRANAEDGWASASVSVKVRNAVNAFAIYKSDGGFFGGGYSNNKDNSLKEAILYSVESDYWAGNSKSWHDAYIQLVAKEKDTKINVSNLVAWTSSNPTVASVDSTGKVTAVSAGTAKITCTALDGSGKKATTSVKVINPTSGVTVISASTTTWGDDEKILGVGKSVKNKAYLSDAFGKPSITKVNWEVSVEVKDSNGNRKTSLEKIINEKKLITINNSGTVSAKSGLKDYADNYSIIANVTASTTDNTGLEGSVKYHVANTNGQFYFWNGYRYVTSISGRAGFNWRIRLQIVAMDPGPGGYYGYIDFAVKSSNPEIAGGTIVYEESGVYVDVYTNGDGYGGGKKGTATITVMSTDGSNKKGTIKVILK